MTTTTPKLQQTGIGTVNRTVTDKLNEQVSVKDFGAVGDGVTNDRAAIQAAILAATLQRSTVVFPTGIYNITAPIDVRGVPIVLNGATVRPATTFASAVMADGKTSQAIFYCGVASVGNSIRGTYNHTNSDISAADAGGVTRAIYCIEILGTAAGQCHNNVFEDLRVQYASTANIVVHGAGYLHEFNRINSIASPVGFSVNAADTSPTGSQGPVTFNNCYALVCGKGFYLNTGAALLNNPATDNCTLGIHIVDALGGVIINGWGCESVYEAMYCFNSKVIVNNGFFGTLGASSPDNTNAYAGIGGIPVAATVNVFSTQGSDLTLAHNTFSTATTDWNKFLTDSAPVAHAGTGDTRIKLINNRKYGVWPVESIVTSFGSSKFSYYPETQIRDLDAYTEYTAPSTVCTGAILTACSWKAVRDGRVVTLTLPTVQGNGVAATAITFGATLPAAFRPTADICTGSVALINNGVNVAQGVVVVSSAGVIKVYRDTTFAVAFTVTANAGIQYATSISWVV